MQDGTFYNEACSPRIEAFHGGSDAVNLLVKSFAVVTSSLDEVSGAFDSIKQFEVVRVEVSYIGGWFY